MEITLTTVRRVTDFVNTAVGYRRNIHYLNRRTFVQSKIQMDTLVAAERVVELMNKSAVTFGLLFGYEMGLFDVMALFDTPKPAAEIASAAKVVTRYLEEWLGVMVNGGIVETDPENSGYFLPQAYRPVLTSTGPLRGWALMARCLLDCYKGGEPHMKRCLSTGDGIPYACYEGFHEMLEAIAMETITPDYVKNMINEVSGLQADLDRGIVVGEVGCGGGVMLIQLAELFPNSTFFGFDFDNHAIDLALSRKASKGLTNVHFKVSDAARPFADENTLDYVVAHNCIHDMSRPDLALKTIHASLKEGGHLTIIDFKAESGHFQNKNHPTGAMLYTISMFHCLPVSMMDPNSVALGTAWGKQKALDMITAAGFLDVRAAENFPAVISNLFVAHK